MKKLSLVGLIVFILIAFVSAFFGYRWWNEVSTAPSTTADNYRFVIPKGSSATWVANHLYQSRLIKNPLAFKIYVQVTDKASNIKPGEFTLSADMSLLEVVGRLIEGPDELWVTIPEGLRREEVAIKVIEQLGINDMDFYQDFIDATEVYEGYLFPDTYLFPSDVTVSKVVEKMLLTFESRYSQAQEGNSSNKRSKDQVVKMASIIERESRSSTERPVVAGILWKRLDTPGWLIQADATVQYAIINSKLNSKYSTPQDWWPILTREDLKIDSLYNSYLYKDLPPTPIANPGLSSIKAALAPQETDYWFYIHDEDGNIHYAIDQYGHNRNIQQYLR